MLSLSLAFLVLYWVMVLITYLGLAALCFGYCYYVALSCWTKLMRWTLSSSDEMLYPLYSSNGSHPGFGPISKTSTVQNVPEQSSTLKNEQSTAVTVYNNNSSGSSGKKNNKCNNATVKQTQGRNVSKETSSPATREQFDHAMENASNKASLKVIISELAKLQTEIKQMKIENLWNNSKFENKASCRDASTQTLTPENDQQLAVATNKMADEAADGDVYGGNFGVTPELHFGANGNFFNEASIVVDASPAFAGGFFVHQRERVVLYYSFRWTPLMRKFKRRFETFELINATLACMLFDKGSAWKAGQLLLLSDNDAVIAALNKDLRARSNWVAFAPILDLLEEHGKGRNAQPQKELARSSVHMYIANQLTGDEHTYYQGPTKATKVKVLTELYGPLGYAIEEVSNEANLMFNIMLPSIELAAKNYHESL